MMIEPYVALRSCGWCQRGEHERCDGTAPSMNHAKESRAMVFPGIGSVPIGAGCYCARAIHGDDFMQPKRPHEGQPMSGLAPR